MIETIFFNVPLENYKLLLIISELKINLSNIIYKLLINNLVM